MKEIKTICIILISEVQNQTEDRKKEECVPQINSLLAELINWFHSNLLNLNLNKTHYLEFNPTKRQEEGIHLKCDNTDIPAIIHTKFLGLIIDNTLSWNAHIDSLIRKMSPSIMTLYSQYIFSIIMFTLNNKHIFSNNNEIHKYDTRSNNLLHPPLTNLMKHKKGPYVHGITRKFLKCCLQESLLLVLVMILIIFFWSRNTLFAIGEVHQNIRPYDIME